MKNEEDNKYMSIVLNPITLPASKMFASMTTLIGEIRFNETLQPSDIVDDMVDSARIGQVDFGKGIVNTFKLDVQPVKDLTETSTAFTITKPNVGQETIEIDNYKFVPLSISDALSRDAVLNGEAINTFFSFVMSLLEDTSKFYLFDIINNLYQTWTPGQATQTIEINQKKTEGLTGAELNATLTWNANEIAKVMRKTVNNMKIKNTKYTDKDVYTDANNPSIKNAKVVSALKNDNLKLVFNDKYYTNFMADTLASLYHSEKLGEMIPGDKFVLLPEDAMSQTNTNTIAWLSAKNKFALADFYKMTLSIKDPSTLYENYFMHFAFGTGVFKYAPGVKFVAKEVEA